MNLIDLAQMNALGKKLSSYISKGEMNSVSTIPFGGGAVDIVVVEQPDGSFKSSPWNVKFGKFHGILWCQDKIVKITVNGIEVGFHMYLSSAGKAYFKSEIDDDGEGEEGGMEKFANFGIKRSDSSDAAEIAAQLLELQWWMNLTTKHKDAVDDQEPVEIQCLSASERENGVDENLYKEEDELTSSEEFFSSDLDDESKNSEARLSISSSSSRSCEVEDDSFDNENQPINEHELADCKFGNSFSRKMVKVLTPTSAEVASLNLKEGGNTITFTFCSSILGLRQIDARIYLWKWNSRIVVSDVDGTITRSDVLGLCMPLVGIDWSQAGVAQLYSAIKENGYHLLFLSARSISQARITRKFLLNLKQDGSALPDGPVVISPDGIFPSLYREVIKRVPHEFKIACLENIKALFPPDCNPFCAGFGNRDTDKISYLKVGVPKKKVFIINPKGEIIVDRHVQTETYTSIHALVNIMFPPIT